MKKYITAALLFCAALTAACSKETAGSADTGDTGALEMRVSATRAEADGEYDPLQRLATARAASCCANTPQRRSPHGWSCSRANTAWRSMREKPSPRRSPNVSTKARRPLRWQPDRRP